MINIFGNMPIKTVKSFPFDTYLVQISFIGIHSMRSWTVVAVQGIELQEKEAQKD